MIDKYLNWFIPGHFSQNPDILRRARQLMIITQIAPLFFLANIIKWYKIGSPTLALSMTAVLIENTVKQIQDVSGLVAKSNQDVEKVASSVGKAVVLIGEIAAGSSEQSQGVSEINRAIAELNRLVHTNTIT